jgi:hypothetical protein
MCFPFFIYNRVLSKVPETGKEMRSQDENSTQGKNRRQK